MRLILGAALGAAIGGVIGYFGKCSTGACPLTGSPWSGAIFGALIGVMIAHAFSGNASTTVATGPAPSNLREVASEEEFTRALNEARGPVLVDFFATWCGPCKRMMPELHQVAARMNDSLTVIKVDVEKAPKLAERYGVRGVPALFVVDKGDVRQKAVGYHSAQQLEQLISSSR